MYRVLFEALKEKTNEYKPLLLLNSFSNRNEAIELFLECLENKQGYYTIERNDYAVAMGIHNEDSTIMRFRVNGNWTKPISISFFRRYIGALQSRVGDVEEPVISQSSRFDNVRPAGIDPFYNWEKGD